jgi:chloramphenicol O-acetyltransferase type A
MPNPPSSAARELDLSRWPRRGAFEFYRHFDKPYFNLCARVDAARVKAAAAGTGGLALACCFVALRLCHLEQPFRWRLQGGRVWEHDRLHGSMPVAREDDSFAFARFDDAPDFATFAQRARVAVAAARRPDAPFGADADSQDVVHFTSLPWVHFTSFSHARNWGREDAIPKIAFGRADVEGSRLMLPLSIEVHHAMMDGAHVGRWLQRFEAVLAAPEEPFAGHWR